MNQQPQQRINHLISTLQRYFPLLIVPAIAGLVLATIYAFFLMPEMWTARQSFLIRDDLSGTAFKLGRFDSEESRKSAQETILEVARRPLVIRNVLEKLGPSSSFAGSNWITDEVIEDTQGVIDISAPNGAEFGKTDAIVLTAKDSTRERTRKFIELLSEEIMTQTNRIRSMRFESMESELYQAYRAAELARDDAIDRLDKLDQRLGSDFGFLSLQGQNNQQQPSGVEAIKSEILRKQDELERAEAVLAALSKAFASPAAAAQLPSEVLIAQPALQDAMSKMLDLREELHVARGIFSNKHPRVKGIAEAIEFSQQQIYDSLTGEMAGVQEDIALKKRQLARLNNRIEELKARLIRLSKSRSEHMALATQVQQLGEAANRAKSIWTETKTQAKTARTVGLITPTDIAQVNSRPDGIGKRYVALAGLFGGLLVGVGLVLLVAPPMDPKPNSPQNGNASLQTTSRQTESSRVPQHRASNPASTGAFQYAASAMQSAADAMRMAATSEPTEQPVVAPPNRAESAAPPQAAQNTTPRHSAADSQKASADEAVRMAFQHQSQSALPRDARAQPIAEQASTTQANPTQANTTKASTKQASKRANKPTQTNPTQTSTTQANTTKTDQRTTPQTDSASSANPFLKNPATGQKTDAVPLPKAKTVPASAPANVRPVDLAKSASVNNEFVRVTEMPEAHRPNADTKPVEQPKQQRAKTDSSVAQSARATTDSAPASQADTQTSTRDSEATMQLSDEEKPNVSQNLDQQRKPVGTEPFVVSANGEAQAPDIDQNLIDAIPDQIRKLSDSILKFGKGKK